MRNDYRWFEIDVDRRIVLITFREVAAGGAKPYGHTQEAAQLFRDIATDDAIDVAMVTGSGETFGPAADAPGTLSLADDASSQVVAYESARSFVHACIHSDKPLIVAMNGDAFLIGVTIALLGDIIVAEQHVRFRDEHVISNVSSSTGPFIWPQSVGIIKAKRYLLTGEWINAHDAEGLGLVTEVVTTGESVSRAWEYALKLSGLQQEAVRYTKRALNAPLRHWYEAVFLPALGTQFLTHPFYQQPD